MGAAAGFGAAAAAAGAEIQGAVGAAGAAGAAEPGAKGSGAAAAAASNLRDPKLLLQPPAVGTRVRKVFDGTSFAGAVSRVAPAER